jgi:transposase-like protein
MSDRKRQRYTNGFKAEAVRLLIEGERTAAAVARDLGLRADLLGSGSRSTSRRAWSRTPRGS